MKQTIKILTIIVALCVCSQKAMSNSTIDKYIPFLSCFSDSTYYAIDTISGHEILFVSRDVFYNKADDETTQEAIAAQLYTLDTKGKILCLGEARSQGIEPANIADIRNTFVRPLPTGIDINNLIDATVSASFTTNDFGWMGGNLTMTVYGEQIYDTVDLHQLQVGDSILYSGDTIIVCKKEEKNGELQINGGFDNNGVTLWPYEGGTYRAVQYDDHSVYVKVGKVELPLSDNFTIVDCHENPQTPSITIRKNQKLYLEKLKASRREFSYLDTTVLIEKGLITNITRHWIP